VNIHRLACLSPWICLAALSAITSQTPAPTPAPDKTALARAEALRVVDAWLDSIQAYRDIPAISAGVVVGDNLVWSNGYGTLDADHKIPAGSDSIYSIYSIYSICSISKLFTSISLMQQYEAGKLRLDDPITTYLPWAKLKDDGEDSVPITLRGMLSHSAGLPRESDFPYWSGPDFPFPTRDQIRASIANQCPRSPAERYFEYSNLGLTLVGETVEAVSGETYAQYAKTHVLDPIGLHDTRTSRTSMPMDTRLAVGYGALKRDGSRDLLKPFNTQGPDVLKASTLRDLSSRIFCRK
jgi:CubicO group peptidase (beta-lactamase class C family)